MSFPAAIGEFVIGFSAIGGDPTVFDWTTTVLSQYANSPTLVQLCESVAGYFDQTLNLQAFLELVWNVDSAQGWGLDVWGRIVGVSRTLNVDTSGKFLGFEEAGTFGLGTFGEAPFYSGVTTSSNFVLADDPYRTLVLAKAFANLCDGSVLSLNQLLLMIFPGRGNIYVTDGADMTMTVTSAFALTAVETAILTRSGVFPRPCGVSFSLITP